ncbi:MAG TPA: hypothetical protein VGH29_17195 [Candidatus Binataceae bacterium]|jgi:hypothetical protein
MELILNGYDINMNWMAERPEARHRTTGYPEFRLHALPDIRMPVVQHKRNGPPPKERPFHAFQSVETRRLAGGRHGGEGLANVMG